LVVAIIALEADALGAGVGIATGLVEV